MNRKVVTGALALFILVNLYFLSQSSFFKKGTSQPQPNPVNPPKKDDNGNPDNENNNVDDSENENNEEENTNNEDNENENKNGDEDTDNSNNEDDNKEDSPMLFEPTAVKPLKTHYKLCIGIHSARAYYEKRSSIRQSWLRVAKSMKNVLVRFTVGDQGPADEASEIGTDLLQEVKDYPDIALLPMVDTYNNLTRKTATWLWWTAHMHAQGHFSCEYVMKTDDDTWVNVGAIVDKLQDKPKEKMAFAYWRGPENVHRGGKWGEPDWPVDKYPQYPHAAGYILSSDLASFLGNAFMDGWLKPYANEDANMGIWLSMVKHEKINEAGFYGNHCYDSVLTLYGQTSQKIIEMGQNFEKCHKPCSRC